MKKHIMMMLAVLAMMASCSGNKFKVAGNVEGAGDTTQLVLEVSSNGYWFVVDTVNTTAGGKFSVAAEAPEFPNIYRLRLGEKAICFGDYSYYWVADRQNRTFRRLNELYARTDQVGFMTTQRVDGKLILPEAVKVLQQA